MNSTSGIVHNSGIADGDLVHLPLEEVRAKVMIVDVSAKVTLTQVFRNTSEHSTSRAVYHFPVPASAAICAFEMRLADGRIIQGISKDNELAREEYENAVRTGREASLLKWVTDDIFTISIGCIPAQDTVETKLVFVMNLMNENIDQIRFQLPMHVGERYGDPPEDLIGAEAPSTSTRLRITVDVQTSGRILKIDSPSHTGEITVNKYSTHLDRPSRRRATVKFRSQTFLRRDFILLVEAEKLDSPRCFAELEGDPTRKATLALQLTVIPKFNLFSMRSQEYIFVVDRSGSMDNDRIETAKRTLNMLLSMLLPTAQTMINIFSFGSDVDSHWPQSVLYTEENVNDAKHYVAGMSANYGGTEIVRALDATLNSCRTDMSTAIFLLTDGESYDADNAFRLVKNAVSNAPTNAPIRVYVLGIGDGVSSSMCERIANAGDGVCLFATTAESITIKCAQLLRAGRTPLLKNVQVDWGIPDEHLAATSTSTVTFSSTSSRTPLRLRSFPVLQQAPAYICDVNASMRFTVYSIIRLKNISVPGEVILRGQRDDTGEAFAYHVPIRGVQLSDADPGLPMIHRMAAWRLIQEHVAERATLPVAVPVAGLHPSNDDLRKAAIVRLGETYQLVSPYTSFVAVQDPASQGDVHGMRRRSNFGSWNAGTSRDSVRNSISENSVDSSEPLPTPSYNRNAAPVGMPGSWPESRSSTPSIRRETGDYSDEGYDSAGTFTTLSSVESYSSDWSDWSEWSEPPSPISEEMQRSASPLLIPRRFAPPNLLSSQLSEPAPRTVSPPPPPPVQREVFDLLNLQSFDGSYSLTDTLHSLVGDRAFNEITNLGGINDKTWATALSVAYMMQQIGNQVELLDDLLLKPLVYLRSVNAETLVAHAQALL